MSFHVAGHFLQTLEFIQTVLGLFVRVSRRRAHIFLSVLRVNFIEKLLVHIFCRVCVLLFGINFGNFYRIQMTELLLWIVIHYLGV